MEIREKFLKLKGGEKMTRDKKINIIKGYLATYLSVEQYAEVEKIIKSLQIEDTIEREKYDLLKRQLADSWNRIDELDKLNGRMQDKINKAIEDMERNIKYNTDPETGLVNLLGQGQLMMLYILKRNIGRDEV